jgi:hypothetical protein
MSINNVMAGEMMKFIFIQVREVMKLMTSGFHLMIILELVQVFHETFLECQFLNDSQQVGNRP